MPSSIRRPSFSAAVAALKMEKLALRRAAELQDRLAVLVLGDNVVHDEEALCSDVGHPEVGHLAVHQTVVDADLNNCHR
ncbi:MAG: hypothetical protein QM714_10395 [Nocardioides sp.]